MNIPENIKTENSNVHFKTKCKILLMCCFLMLAPKLWAVPNAADSIRLHFEDLIAQSNHDLLTLSQTHYDYAVFLDENGNIDEAIEQLKAGIEAATKISNDSIFAKTANYLGGIYWSEGDCNNSTFYFEQGLKHAERINNNELISVIKMNLSGNYGSSGQNEKAIQFALDALEIKEKNNKSTGLCYDYIMVGEIFQNIGNIEKWKYYVHKAYQLKDTENCAILSDIVMIYNNLGRIAEAEKEFNKALAYYDTIVQVSKPVAYNQGIGIALLNSALILQMQEKPEKALESATESEQYLGDVPYFVMAINNVKTELFQQLGKKKEALELAQLNIQNENMLLYPVIRQDCLGLLYKLNFELENYKTANSWNDTLRAYEAKLREDETLKTIEELETKYQTEKKEQQIELLSAENQIKTQRIFLFVALSILLLLLFTIGLLLYYRNKKRNQQTQETLRQQLLRSQMNPHFLFNALGSIQNYMLNNDTKKAAGYLNNFASLTRAILDHSAAETVMLDDEIKALHNYIKLEQMRMQYNFEYSIDLDESVETEFINIPPMLIQPFVENAIKHGLKNKEADGELKICIEDQEDTLKVTISDNGKGFDKNNRQNQDHKSMAMDIFNKRIGLLKKKYSKKAGFEIQSAPNQGTKVYIHIPIIN